MCVCAYNQKKPSALDILQEHQEKAEPLQACCEGESATLAAFIRLTTSPETRVG